MADYKKKKITNKTSTPDKAKTRGKRLNSFSTTKNTIKDDIKMSSSKPTHRSATVKPRRKNTRGFKVLKGGKGKIERTKLFSLVIIGLIVFSIFLFCVLTPTGPFEYIENKFHTFGSGEFPRSVMGSELYDGGAAGNVIYTLTDTHAEIINKSGKELFSRQHDFNSPMLSTSSQRAIVYDAGGKKVYVYNYKDVVDMIETKHEIYCADISRNGTLAIATKSEGYASQVEVLSKGGDVKFVWYSATEIVNNVALSNNGKRLAVSTVDTTGGNYKSKVYIFKYSKAEPIHEFTYDGAIVYSLNTLSSSRFSVVTDKTIDFIKWKGGSRNEHPNTYTLNLYRICGKKNIAVTGNKSNNKISVFSSSGKVVAEFDFLGAVSDIYYTDGHVFILSDGYLYTLNSKGEMVYDKINLSGYSRIFAIDSNTIIAGGNFGFDKFNLK